MYPKLKDKMKKRPKKNKKFHGVAEVSNNPLW